MCLLRRFPLVEPLCGSPVLPPLWSPVVLTVARTPGNFCVPKPWRSLLFPLTRARVSGLGLSKALGQKWGLYKIENQAVQASNTFQHHLYKIENQAALENTNIPQLSKKNLYKIMPKQNDVLFCFFLLFFLVFYFFLSVLRLLFCRGS